MKTFFAHVLANVVAFWLVSYLSLLRFEGLQTYFIAALILVVVNTFIKPICKLLSFPVRLLTLGMFSIVINMLMIALTAFFVKGMFLNGVFNLFFASLLISFFTVLITKMVK